MVKSVENGTSLPPFLVKCYEMVSDESTNDLISWTESNDSFIIWDESRFSSQLLPKYFKHSNFSSFVRQLNIYGFRKIDTDRLQFANEAFIKGQKHLLKNITRRKNSQSVVKKDSQPKEDTPPATKEDKRIDLWEEVESLKNDKNALMQELKKLRQHQQTTLGKLQLLREQMKGMEKKQQQMLSFIVMAMQSPEFMAQFFQPKENNWRITENGNNKLSEVTDDIEVEPCPSDGMIVRYQPPNDEHLVPDYAMESSKPEDLMEWDFSRDEMKDLFVDIDLLCGPVDKKRVSFENQTQLILPDSTETDMLLEQLLLPYQLTDDGQMETDFGLPVGLSPDPNESNRSNASDDGANESFDHIPEDSGTVDILSKQMNSEMSLNH